MNEQLRQLAIKSGIDIYGSGSDREKWESVLEKFANLIIGKCSLVLLVKSMEYADEGYLAQCQSMNEASNLIRNAIKTNVSVVIKQQ
jgi:hypothetical protein